MQKRFKPVIGLEAHIELGTDSKMFCACPAYHFGKTPNTQVCPVCLGLPGALPIPNKKAIEWTQMLGTALGCTLSQTSHFDRKHYFYPDLPKGYQISQYGSPLARNGGYGGYVRIRRVHLEEDTGKLFHTVIDDRKVSLVDFNRSGVPLVEIVTEPDFSSAAEAKSFAQELRQLVRYLEVSDADMEKGSMRIEANVSLANESQVTSRELPNYRVEVKNINSFRFLEQAINFEIDRQAQVLEGGGKLTQETRGFDEKTGATKSQRGKEEAQDYRYFPEPDIPTLSFTEEELEEIKKRVPELSEGKRKRFEREYGLPPQYTAILTQTRKTADYFEEAVRVGEAREVSPKKIADAIVNKKINIEKVLPEKVIEMLKAAKEEPLLSNKEFEKAIKAVLDENPQAVADYKKGREISIQFLIGQAMKKFGGRANHQKVYETLKERLETR
ncbi:MAG: Asp-tRNA(Asn)/Glu-tRNA(Gln) amidotransferase subunit GatB [Candidatus Blackburnbacteria bacterium]|nr:Asp-tRNA(Asn)/Glu-tRNA(Gln) amidotransferase subunit GatB [Candidatus Blackburnbacteria bacterium]